MLIVGAARTVTSLGSAFLAERKEGKPPMALCEQLHLGTGSLSMTYFH